MLLASQKSSLEAFFSIPSAANFPQPSGSRALTCLFSDLSEFLNALLLAVPEFPIQEQGHALALSKRAVEVTKRFQTSVDDVTANDLVSMLQEAGSALKAIPSPGNSVPKAILKLRSVLASLIVYAKESRDFGFKKGVLELVRAFESP